MRMNADEEGASGNSTDLGIGDVVRGGYAAPQVCGWVQWPEFAGLRFSHSSVHWKAVNTRSSTCSVTTLTSTHCKRSQCILNCATRRRSHWVLRISQSAHIIIIAFHFPEIPFFAALRMRAHSSCAASSHVNTARFRPTLCFLSRSIRKQVGLILKSAWLGTHLNADWLIQPHCPWRPSSTNA